jgi:hypothetical protein
VTTVMKAAATCLGQGVVSRGHGGRASVVGRSWCGGREVAGELLIVGTRSRGGMVVLLVSSL